MFFLFVLVFNSQNEQKIEEKILTLRKRVCDFDYSRIRLFSQLLFVSYRAFMLHLVVYFSRFMETSERS